MADKAYGRRELMPARAGGAMKEAKPGMTPARFLEVFEAAITLDGSGIPTRWRATSPLVSDDIFCTGETPEQAIKELVTQAVRVSLETMTKARESLAYAEERWRRIEAAAAEIGES